MDKNGAAYLAASFATANALDAVAARYLTWLNAQPTMETAINALLASANSSKNPTTVLSTAATRYSQFETDPPTIASATPSTGAAAGGTVVNLVGTNFTGATGVTVGGSAATAVVVVDDTHMHFAAPSHATGTVSIVVTTPYGSATKTGYIYT